MDTVVEGRAFINGRLEQCCIGIKDGRIKAIKKDIRGETHHNFNDKIILPGAIDVHVHLRDPGQTHKEDFHSGTLSALHGGVTCVFDMPNTVPPTITLETLREKKEIASRKAWTDFGLFAGLVPDSIVLDVAKEAIGFKMFLGSSTQSQLVQADDDIKRLIELVGRTGKVLSVHAEEESLIRRQPAHSLHDHEENRPEKAELHAIQRLNELGKGERINICHVSSAAALTALTVTGFSKEVTTHHMLLDRDSDLGARGKVNPPLRSPADREAVFQAFQQGKFDFLASDHAPHTFDEKSEGFAVAPSGIPGVETSLPMMLALVKRNKLDMGVLVRCAAENAGTRFGIRKGRIAIGYDADLMVIDSTKVTRIAAEELHSKCAWTPYERREAIFPVAVFLRGDALIEEGDIVGERKGADVVTPV